ncbi:MAG TPA: TonB-dependent receptor [Gemmatimonadales bacterium]|nr:TonB-dependent receptor [Gemmatimonadales bacterium]
MHALSLFRSLLPLGPLALVAITLLVAAVPLAAQGIGRVQGRVTESESDRGLEGARVTLRRSTLVAVTDAKGHYVLPRVPVGADTIEVAYIGRQRQSQAVTVGPGQTTQADFQLGIAAVALEEIQVLGVRAKTQAEALSRQQNAANIQNIVASDQMGRFPDASAPEAVQRLPGIAVERDQGEGRYIQIRGGAAQNTMVTFNGEQIPSPEPEKRQIELDAVPVDVLESIEVSKAITPDMDADAIGGSVNLVTKKAPDVPLISLEAAGGYAPIREDFSGNGALTYGSRVADGRFGFLLSGSYSRRNFGSDDAESEYDVGDPGLDDDGLGLLDLRHHVLWRERIGATGTFDYRLSPTSNLSLTGIYSDLGDEEQRRRFMNVVEDGVLEFRHKNRLERQKTWNLTFAGDHLLGNGIGLDYHATLTRSIQDTPYDNEIFFVQEDVAFNPDLSDPDQIQANPDATAVGGTYLFDGFEPETSYGSNLDRVFAANLTFPFGLGGGASGKFKVGAKYRHKHKWQDFVSVEMGLADGSPDVVLGQDVGQSFPVDRYEPGNYQYIPFSTTPDEVRNFGGQFGSSLETEAHLEEDTNDGDLTEKVVAGYVMSEINITPDLMVLPGVRYEHTRFRSTGFEFDPDAEALITHHGEKDYGRFFPALHVRYRVGPQTNVRAAVTTAMARPNFLDLLPYRLRDDEDLTLGNPALDPTTSTNLDFLVEHYDQRIGVISAGVFYKRIKDPIFLFTEDNELGGETTQPRNGDKGHIAGVELAVQQQLQMLPKPFDGLGIYANYTYTDSKTNLPGGREARLQGQAPHVFNTALSYEKGPFSGQFSLNYHDNYVLEFGGDEGTPEEALEDLIVDDHLQLDFSGTVRITSTTAAFLELVNLTNEPYRVYQGVSERPIQREFYRSWGRFGFRFTR